MAFCGNCGREVPPGDAFCRACGAPLVAPEPEGAVDALPAIAPPAPTPVAPPAVAPPAVESPTPPTPAPAAPASPTPAPLAPPAPAMARRFPLWAAVLIGVLVLAIVGGAAAAFVALVPAKRSAPVTSSADPGSLGFDAEPFVPLATSTTGAVTGFAEPSATTQPAATSPTPSAQQPEPAPAPSPTPAPAPAPRLTQVNAIDTVGRMLDYMHRGKRSQALALVTKNMLSDVSNDKTWFSPGPDVLISFEVQDATKRGNSMRVRVLEQWNSGPERTSYDVVLSGGKPKVDGIKWSSW